MPIAPKPYRPPRAGKRPGKLDYGQRPSAGLRGYGARWRKLRAWYLARHPLCEWPGCEQPATDVDHRVPRARGGSDQPSNLQALCHRHHSRKTVLEDGGFGQARGRRAGLIGHPERRR